MINAFWKNKNILITGAHGFVGTRLYSLLLQSGVSKSRIIAPESREADFRRVSVCNRYTKNIDIVIHLAGNVGGIGKNQRRPGELFYDNAVMGIELLEAARRNNVSKFVTIGTVCAYPKYTPPPFKEEDLWIGYPEETNAPYGLAKKMLLVQSQAYRDQYGMNAIYLTPVNIYGPGDDFSLEDSHVIPGMIRKFHDALSHNAPFVTLWGDGSPTREFLYVEDAARGIMLATERYNGREPVNVGSSAEISIRDLAGQIAHIVGYKGQIQWDVSMPNGQPRRLLDTSKAKRLFGFEAKTSLGAGLRKTVKWYLETV